MLVVLLNDYISTLPSGVNLAIALIPLHDDFGPNVVCYRRGCDWVLTGTLFLEKKCFKM